MGGEQEHWIGGPARVYDAPVLRVFLVPVLHASPAGGLRGGPLLGRQRRRPAEAAMRLPSVPRR